jgi:outer membrane protein OmpA-like peptidoglycan-associated protein
MAELPEASSQDNELARLSQRVSVTVEREQRRRKRLLVIYLILLLIPLAIWIWVVSTQSRQKEQREQEVASVVEGRIKTTLQEEARAVREELDGRVAELEPALASIQAIEPHLSELSDLQTQLAGLEDGLRIVQRMEPALASMEQTNEALSARVAQLEAEQAAMQDTLAALNISKFGQLAQTVQDLDAVLQQQTRRLETVSTGQASLLADMEELRDQTTKASAQNQEALLTMVAALKGQISELDTRLSDLEAGFAEHASGHRPESASRLEASLDSLRQRVDRLESQLKCPDGGDCPVSGSTIRIDQFETGSAELPRDAIGILKERADAVAGNQAARVRIVGHTDSQGGNASNNDLSLARATEVWRFMLANGVSAKQLELRAAGEHQPIFPNDSDEGRSLNRRVELIITGM